MTTVLEALLNAQINLETAGRMGASRNPIYAIGMEQLSNAIKALEDGKPVDFILQDSMLSDINK